MNKTMHEGSTGKTLFYLKNEMLITKSLLNDFAKPHYISKLLRNRLTGITIWRDFAREPEFKDRERLICVIDGTEEFRMVSPIYKQNIYSGVFEELQPTKTPVNFFHANLIDHPLFEEANLLTVQVHKGGCVFVPAYYWMQSQTISTESTLLTFEYESHSELVTLLFQAIDRGILQS